MYKSLLHILIISNILICSFILIGGLYNQEFAKFNIFVIIPLIYVLNIFPIEPIISSQYYIADKCINNYPENKNKSPAQVVKENANLYVLPIIQEKISNVYYDTFNPVNYQGLLVLGYIINIYALKYKWNEF